MPKNLNAIIRYQTIDRCLRNPYRQWAIGDLQAACARALGEAQGRDTNVSERTIRDDIRIMRSDILGYNAPIEIADGHYYYADKNYSIQQSPLARHDVELLSEVAGILKQLSGFNHFQEIKQLLTRLESKLSEENSMNGEVIQIDQVPDLKGLHWLDILRKHIIAQQTIDLQYKPFHRQEPMHFALSPYLLKEYNNRWFVLGHSARYTTPTICALDRIESITPSSQAFVPNTLFDPQVFFRNIIGVTLPEDGQVETIDLFVFAQRKGYVLTKPLHNTQKIIDENKEGVHIRLQVVINHELIANLLYLGQSVKVLGPPQLVTEMKDRLQSTLAHYLGE